MIIKCEWCGREFEPLIKNGKYCSPECRYEVSKVQMRLNSKLKRDAERRLKTRYCAICGAKIDYETGRKKYCSDKCYEIGKKLNKAADYYRRLSMKKEEPKPLNPHVLDEAERELQKYNQTHGTNYSYGWYQHLKKLGKL